MDRGSLIEEIEKLLLRQEWPVWQSNVCEMMKDAINQLTNRLDADNVQAAKQSFVEIVEKKDDGQKYVV